MFKDVFVLNKKAWHVWMVRKVWRLSYTDFSHICPYFWLCIFTVIISPIVFPIIYLWKLLKILGAILYIFLKYLGNKTVNFIDYVGGKIDTYIDHRMQKWEERCLRELEESIDKSVAAKVFKHLNSDEVYALRSSDYYIDKSLDAPKSTKKWIKLFKKIMERDPEKYRILEEQRQARLRAEMEEDYRKRRIKNEKMAKFQAEQEEQERKRYLLAIEERREMAIHAAKIAAREAEKRRIKHSREEIDRLARIANKQRINRILKYAMPIGKAVIIIAGAIVAGFGIYYLFIFIGWVYNFFQAIPSISYTKFWHMVGSWLVYIGVVVGIIAIVVGVVISVRWIVMKLVGIGISFPRWNLNKRLWHPIGRGIVRFVMFLALIRYIVYPFIWLIKGIITFFRILIQTIKNNCPAIDWKD